ncbi:hypothetical protein GW17_00028903 [Ensete ventricosum]|nr:hypothetical protein GW17_00028903 [Ensete ventricosum]RZR91602.1 hypothetical protein BHM03_00019772 [Ensete ventricosum]
MMEKTTGLFRDLVLRMHAAAPSLLSFEKKLSSVVAQRSGTNGQDLSGSARTPASPSGVQSSPASPSHAHERRPRPPLPFPSHLRHGGFASRRLSSRRR